MAFGAHASSMAIVVEVWEIGRKRSATCANEGFRLKVAKLLTYTTSDEPVFPGAFQMTIAWSCLARSGPPARE